ncbi:ammonium transporter [Bacterioplanes sanyensis]|uniref:Ammonium transporter n=1 Tax=Bacterioplanes sanyensis TaxID=1249553 RepID=A0A222FFV2_9GAMM|nr:ammonium transporter [Bacterioplanes sanyensis]ASP37374.1 ammonium transporter [Bacterioplanes sanyensis]
MTIKQGLIGIGWLAPGMAMAQPTTAPEMILSMNTVWIVMAAALVFFMQAGFALLESGMSRAKNAVNVMMKNYMDVCLGSLVFWFVGYGLMFGDNPSGLLGMSHFGVSQVSDWDYSLLLFQTMFAATAVTICSGAMAERTRYDAYLLAAAVMVGVIYPIFGSWVWGGLYGGSGWLADLGFIDFAGSTVVHSIGAWCALAGIIVLGPRSGRFDKHSSEARAIPGHNLSLVALGGFILWLGWFGFNGGSTLAAGSDIGKIVLNTHLAAAAGAVGAWLMSRLIKQPVLLTATVNGSLAGLVAITAGCAVLDLEYAALTGLIGGGLAVMGSRLLERWRLDDVVGAIPVHGFAGVWGTLAAGLFVADDLFNMTQLLVQLIGAVAAFLWAFPLALLLFFVLRRWFGLRASTQHEQQGLDFSEHDEVGYPEFHQHATYVRE